MNTDNNGNVQGRAQHLNFSVRLLFWTNSEWTRHLWSTIKLQMQFQSIVGCCSFLSKGKCPLQWLLLLDSNNSQLWQKLSGLQWASPLHMKIKVHKAELLFLFIYMPHLLVPFSFFRDLFCRHCQHHTNCNLTYYIHDFPSWWTLHPPQNSAHKLYVSVWVWSSQTWKWIQNEFSGSLSRFP